MKIKKPKYKYNSALLIDDNELDNFINEKMLESTHFSRDIFISVNGERALHFINERIVAYPEDNETCIDVMFVDLNMPVMNGAEFIENFQKMQNQKLAKCKIVVLTSSVHNKDRVNIEKLNNNIIFVNKPLTNDFLNSL